MNTFASHAVDEDVFGEKKGNIVQAFDAFPKAKPQYVTRTSGGGKWTVAMLLISSLLIFSELKHWWHGYLSHGFSVEKGVGHDMQINLDMTIAMSCPDIHLNVQDAAGDRILAAEKLKRDPTNWAQWIDKKGMHILGKDAQGRLVTEEGFHDHEEGFGEESVRDIIAVAGAMKLKFARTPKLRGNPPEGDSCRIYGSLDVNKVQGDFHVTARGHGYQEFGVHLDHTRTRTSANFRIYRLMIYSEFNFSHIISELSFGSFYPSLLNPLDGTVSTSPNHFHKYQYFLSIVPTIYSVETAYSNHIVHTNQYAVTDQSQMVGERSIPGIFFKYDIEPMLLIIEESRDGFLQFLIKVVNVVSGVLVAGHWGFTITEWAISVLGKMKPVKSEGVLNGRVYESGYY